MPGRALLALALLLGAPAWAQEGLISLDADAEVAVVLGLYDALLGPETRVDFPGDVEGRVELKLGDKGAARVLAYCADKAGLQVQEGFAWSGGKRLQLVPPGVEVLRGTFVELRDGELTLIQHREHQRLTFPVPEGPLRDGLGGMQPESRLILWVREGALERMFACNGGLHPPGGDLPGDQRTVTMTLNEAPVSLALGMFNMQLSGKPKIEFRGRGKGPKVDVSFSGTRWRSALQVLAEQANCSLALDGETWVLVYPRQLTVAAVGAELGPALEILGNLSPVPLVRGPGLHQRFDLHLEGLSIKSVLREILGGRVEIEAVNGQDVVRFMAEANIVAGTSLGEEGGLLGIQRDDGEQVAFPFGRKIAIRKRLVEGVRVAVHVNGDGEIVDVLMRAR